MKPGWQYGAGTHVDRNITWWEEAGAFFQYLARCQYLLQQGTFVADALYFYGEGVTKFVPSRKKNMCVRRFREVMTLTPSIPTCCSTAYRLSMDAWFCRAA